jgi:DNA-binding transcriptional LysR family regulator
MLNNLDAFKVKVIQAVAETQGVSEAATQLGVSPPAISQCIRNLEKDLKTQLFIRVGKKLKPTPFTIGLCEIASQFFNSVNTLLNSELSAGLKGNLRVGAPPLFGTKWLVPKMTEFLNENPLTKISLTLLDTKRLINDLKEYKLDVIFVDGGSHLNDHSQISSHKIFEEQLIMCCSKKFYQQNMKNVVDYKQLVLHNHIPYHDGKEAIYKWYQHHYSKTPDYPFSLCVDTAEGVCSAIKNDFGLGVVPISTVEKEVLKKEIIIIPGKKSALVSQIVCCQLNEKIPSKIEKSFIQFCQLPPT